MDRRPGLSRPDLCGARMPIDVGLEIDHVQAFHLGGPTELDNLALLCHRRHHRIETYDHWILQCLGTGSEGEP